MTRRRFSVVAAVAAVAAGCGWREPRRRVLVYRGVASGPELSEAAAALVLAWDRSAKIVYVGPGEKVKVTPEVLAGAALYVQPGGGQDIAGAWDDIRDTADAVRDWVRGGGRFLGICMGAYLAGSEGFDLVPATTDGYIDTPGATVQGEADTVIALTWRDKPRHVFFQDGTAFIDLKPDTTVIARYDNGTVAALTAPYGEGRVGVVGPHPEADQSWYDDAGLTNPDGVKFDLGVDLITATLH
ncbi:BPL-N domain-containing protein [Kribbella sp. NPDC058245]|uniref:BPL-N domain-containing protein n=1 Tax=Kribbella sp. NPDC058245 TaxID=3346399 RepID=UPI0036E882B6